ncbi:hypothetical protein GYMLUDRAFT_246144 [Collybiopsis luxurians FD-317 M1]|uniref:Insertion element IS150 protein InsJ-like helix-turn-helix domain-containing protein n=1 Tax=Collybiopsis luxurians FD-317 M1 TaxID=944289 RepID=A0A0D0CS10_9AGAR|nr:hypothetical protein GYMLUDRAFT_246144 [Collybiopsis luxurians FD-317 M1]
MGNCHISSDLKETALRLWEAGWNTSDICSVLAVSQASLYHWRNIFEEFGEVTRPPSAIRGRPRIIGMLALQKMENVQVAYSMLTGFGSLSPNLTLEPFRQRRTQMNTPTTKTRISLQILRVQRVNEE